MTKAKIIETIQNLESELWLDYQTYTYLHAPQGEGYNAVVNWQGEDPIANKARARWATIHRLMEEIGVETIDNEANNQAFHYQSLIFQNSKETA